MKNNKVTKEKIILYLVAASVIVLATLQVVTLFRGPGKDLAGSQAIIEAKDQTIKAIQDQRAIYQSLVQEKERNIQQLMIKDSTLSAQFVQNQTVYKTIDEKLNKIPAYINRIAGNDDSIRAAFAEN